jgi:hypothetical protein
MSNKGVNFAGVDILRPGTYVSIDATAMVPQRSNSAGIVGYIGPSDGGTPGKVYEFASFDDAKRVLKGGPVLSYLSRIFRPSPDLQGASLVRFVRPGSAAKATFAVSAALTLSSLDAGRSANGLLYSISAGTADATLKVRDAAGADTALGVRSATIERPLENYKRTHQLRHGLTLTCSVVPTSSNKNTIVRDQDGATGSFYLVEDGNVVAAMPFGVTTTIKDVASWVNARTAWKATVVGDYDMPAGCLQFPLGSGTPADATYEQSGSPVNTTAFLTPAAGVGALAYMLNRYDAQVEAAVTSYTGAIPAGAVAQSSFIGGTGSGLDTMSSNDVSAALALLATVDVRELFLQSMDPALQALVYQHVTDMRATNAKKFRIGYLGFNAYPATGTAQAPVPSNPTNASGVPLFSGESWVDKYADAIRALDGPIVLAANGTVDANPITGLSEQLYGLGLAAQVCGMASGNNAVEPLTNKAVISQGLQYPTITDADIKAVLNAGGTIAYYDQSLRRTVIMQALTTYQGGANVSFRKLQGLRIQDQLRRGFQDALAHYVGYPLDLSTGMLVQQAVAKYLDSEIRSGSNPAGVLTPGLMNGQSVPAWTNLRVSSDGFDSWTIDVEAHPVGETAYILVNARLTPVAIQL